MSLPTPKELKKLAAACRKAGILKFKQGDLEITISEDAPKSIIKHAKDASQDSAQGDIDSTGDWDALTDEEKLFFSVVGDANDIVERPVK